jgi:hypothetical protein
MRLLSLLVLVSGLTLGSIAKADEVAPSVAGGGLLFGTGPDTLALQGNIFMAVPIEGLKGLRAGGDVTIYLPYSDLNVDLFWFSINPGAQYVFEIPNVPVHPYAEAGLAILFAHASFPGGQSDSSTELGLNLGGGAEYDVKFARVYGMLRYQFFAHGYGQAELGGGLRWAL